MGSGSGTAPLTCARVTRSREIGAFALDAGQIDDDDGITSIRPDIDDSIPQASHAPTGTLEYVPGARRTGHNLADGDRLPDA